VTPTQPPKNLAASVSARLLKLARERREEPQFVQTRYTIERLLYRLSVSAHASSIVLKGAALFAVWSGYPHRPTKDIDLLG
jgi:Nucleotidyl transferase AbiEii toxin, Type IV TA system